MIFKVGGVDFTDKLQENDYSIIEEANYSEWTDCNYHTHRRIEFKKVSGSLVVAFVSVGNADFNDFKRIIEEVEQDGKLYVRLYIQNADEERELWCYYNIKSVKNKTLPNGYVVTKAKMELEEA